MDLFPSGDGTWLTIPYENCNLAVTELARIAKNCDHGGYVYAVNVQGTSISEISECNFIADISYQYSGITESDKEGVGNTQLTCNSTDDGASYLCCSQFHLFSQTERCNVKNNGCAGNIDKTGAEKGNLNCHYYIGAGTVVRENNPYYHSMFSTEEGSEEQDMPQQCNAQEYPEICGPSDTSTILELGMLESSLLLLALI